MKCKDNAEHVMFVKWPKLWKYIECLIHKYIQYLYSYVASGVCNVCVAKLMITFEAKQDNTCYLIYFSYSKNLSSRKHPVFLHRNITQYLVTKYSYSFSIMSEDNIFRTLLVSWTILSHSDIQLIYCMSYCSIGIILQLPFYLIYLKFKYYVVR